MTFAGCGPESASLALSGQHPQRENHMIKTSDLAAMTPAISASSVRARADIERHLDESIRRHVASGSQWPLEIMTTRSGWNGDDIEAVLVKYRSNGWVAVTGGRSLMCVLDPIGMEREYAPIGDPLRGFSPDEIVVGPGGQTLTGATSGRGNE